MKNNNNMIITKGEFEVFWLNLLVNIEHEEYKDKYDGLRVARINLKISLKCINCNEIVFAAMYLVYKYAYTTKSDYGKFTLGYITNKVGVEIPFTLGAAITFRENGEDLPVLDLVYSKVIVKGEDYGDMKISGIFIRIYLSDRKPDDGVSLTNEELASKVWCGINSDVVVEHKEPRRVGTKKSNFKKYITSIKPTEMQRQPFIVADTETVIIDKVHVPYAIGFLVVKPGDDLLSEDRGNNMIETYFSESYQYQIFPTIHDRSNRMLSDFIERLVAVVKKNTLVRTVYFHNFSRFDGIMLLRHLVINGKMYKIKPLMRNNMLYEIAVFLDKKLVFNFRDSLTLLTSPLNTLAKHLCPQLGSKGSIDHENISVDNISTLKYQLISYMKQDILLLGGVMLKAQDIYWKFYNIDIVTKLTLSSLALAIFRTKYYDSDNRPIHIPNRNEDTFIRRGYYGGHADVYIPKGENLYYYDVNSLYPFIMKAFPMPGGKPTWHGSLEDQDLEKLFGFIEAYVECPITMNRPFLPYRDESSKTLLFPTGKFVGVYYSEEFKYARQLGYQITPLSGYLFESNNSTPFGEFVTDIFERRQEAKRSGNEAMGYIYKILLNSLYGRFGINPKSTITEICKPDRYNLLIKKKEIIFGDILSEDSYIISYYTNTDWNHDWKPPRISAVQLSAAITASARIYMYPYISRSDCYYTDTDSVIIGSPLPEEEITSTVLGKFKLEEIVKEGVFLAPKSYNLKTIDNINIIRHKGAAKDLISEEWFKDQYDNTDRITQRTVSSNFRIDWHKLHIKKMGINVNIGIKNDTKRKPVYKKKLWVNTIPFEVYDMLDQDVKILLYKIKIQNIIINDLNQDLTTLRAEMAELKNKGDDTIENPIEDKSNAEHQADKEKKPITNKMSDVIIKDIPKRKKKFKPG